LSSFNASKVLELEIGEAKAQAAWKGLDEYTRDLCRNPLMLTLLADELRATDTPPTNRAELFDRFIDRYLSEWARVKGAGSVRVEKEILSALAWRLGTSRTLLSADEAAAAMSARLTELQSKKEAPVELNVATLNRQFLEHGLLRESAGQTGFFHQAVQEYFFAREVALHQSIEYVLKHVSDPEWAEVLLFVCGLIEDATEVVRDVAKANLCLAALCGKHAKNISGEFVDELALRLIERLKIKFDTSGFWWGKSYPEMQSILAIESKAKSPLLSLFYRAHNDSRVASHNFGAMLLYIEIPPEKSVVQLESLLTKENDISLRVMLASAYRQAERLENSVEQLKQCLDLEQTNGWIWANLGITYRTMHNLEESVLCLQKAIEIGPKTSWRYFEFGRTLCEMGNYELALEQFQRAISIDAEYSSPHAGLGDIYRERIELIDEAIKEYEVAMRLEQRPSRLDQPIWGLARALEAAGRIAEARQRYQEYLDRFPWGEHAAEALAALERLGRDENGWVGGGGEE